MTSKVLLAAVWLVVTAAGVGAAFAAVQQVRSDVTDPAAITFDAGAQSAGSTTFPPAPSGEPTTSSPMLDPTSGGSTIAPSTPPVATTDLGGTIVKTLTSVGGSVTVEVDGNVLTLLGAVPNAGFTVDHEVESPGSMSVDFESSTHESKFDIWVVDGELQHELREKIED